MKLRICKYKYFVDLKQKTNVWTNKEQSESLLNHLRHQHFYGYRQASVAEYPSQELGDYRSNGEIAKLGQKRCRKNILEHSGRSAE